jgi:lysyl-tRNA synthetase class I
MGEKKTLLEVAKLKQEWLAYPYWVLEDTEGFEEHREELRRFRLETHARQERERRERLERLIRYVNDYKPDNSWFDDRSQIVLARTLRFK